MKKVYRHFPNLNLDTDVLTLKNPEMVKSNAQLEVADDLEDEDQVCHVSEQTPVETLSGFEKTKSLFNCNSHNDVIMITEPIFFFFDILIESIGVKFQHLHQVSSKSDSL